MTRRYNADLLSVINSVFTTELHVADMLSSNCSGTQTDDFDVSFSRLDKIYLMFT